MEDNILNAEGTELQSFLNSEGNGNNNSLYGLTQHSYSTSQNYDHCSDQSPMGDNQTWGQKYWGQNPSVSQWITSQNHHIPYHTSQNHHMPYQTQPVPTQTQPVLTQNQPVPTQNQPVPTQNQHFPTKHQHVPPQDQHVASQRCAYCYYYYTNLEDYSNHKKFTHGMVFQTCEMAPNHKESRSKIPRRYACSVCFEIKKDSEDMRTCLATHRSVNPTEEPGPKEYKCPITGCKAKYKINKSLLAHGRLAHFLCFKVDKKEDFTWRCRFCNVLKSTAASLSRHETKCKACPENRQKAKKTKNRKSKPIPPQPLGGPVLPLPPHAELPPVGPVEHLLGGPVLPLPPHAELPPGGPVEHLLGGPVLPLPPHAELPPGGPVPAQPHAEPPPDLQQTSMDYQPRLDLPNGRNSGGSLDNFNISGIEPELTVTHSQNSHKSINSEAGMVFSQ